MSTTSSKIPPGFRFHPTEEELVNYYLRQKVSSKIIDQAVIKEVELYKIEPWDLQDICGIGKEEQHEWYFFSRKDKKYLTGTRTNRATTTGFWKATGRDKPIYFKHKLVGMRKTLVFYKGRAPNGQKLDWILHEYRLETDETDKSQEDGWVVCRLFKKRVLALKEGNKLESPFWYEDNMRLLPSIESHNTKEHRHHLPCCYKEQSLQNFLPHEPHHLQIPPLEIHKIFNCPNVAQELQVNSVQNMDQRKDWRVLEKFVASQLSQDGPSKYPNCTNSQVPYYESSLPTG